MGMGGGGGGGKKRAMSEINITPMVDVMLVLLVIFMVVAPTLKQGFELSLPKADATQTISTEEAQEVVVNDKGQVVRFDDSKPEDHKLGVAQEADDLVYTNMDELVDDLKKYVKKRKDEDKPVIIVLAGHKDARWQAIINAWNAIKKAGVQQVSFQIDAGKPEEETKK